MPRITSLMQTYQCARALEAIENYARADDPFMEDFEESDASSEAMETRYFDTDESFWIEALHSPESLWDKEICLRQFALSEWVARVPGLFWSEGAEELRKLAAAKIECRSRDWITYKPQGKSQIVMGGVGSLKFPPDERDRRLMILSSGHNASSGIPVLISPEPWIHHRLGEGDVVAISARWQKMEIGWAERFPSIKGLPRGYLVLKEPRKIEVYVRNQPTQFHPYTIMEYYRGDAKLLDFVYATADTRVERYRARLEAFFAEYKSKEERYGRYLLSAEINDPNPMFEAEYVSPEQLRRGEPGTKARLELLEARVREYSFGGRTIDSIVALLTSHYDNDSLKRISNSIDIPHSQWFTGSSSADSSAELVQKCLERGKVEELIDAVARDYPDLFVVGG